MGWEYRVIKHNTEGSCYFAVHEVFYDKSGKIETWTADPVKIVGDSKQEVMDTLLMMIQDCKKPVLVESKLLESIRGNARG